MLAIEVMFQFGTYLTSPIVSKYIVFLGASIAVGGFVAGLNASVAMIVRPFVGWFADRVGKKALLLVSAVLFAVAAFGCALSPSPFFVGLFRGVQGVAFALRSAVLVSMVSLVVPRERLGTAVGWIGLASTLSCALGPAIGSAVGFAWGYSASFLFAGILFVAGLILAALIPFSVGKGKEGLSGVRDGVVVKKGEGRGRHSSIRIGDFLYKPALPITLVAGLMVVPNGAALTLIILAGDQRGIMGAAAYFVFFSLAALVSKPLVGRLSDRIGLTAAVAPMLVVELIATVLLAFMGSVFFLIAAGLCMGVGQSSAYSALQAEAVRVAGSDEVGRASNTFFVGPDIGMGMGPLAAGWAMETLGITAMFLLCGFLVLIALCVLLIFEWKRKGNARC